MKAILPDLTGQKFGRLMVKHWTNQKNNGIKLYLCECECGKTKTVRADHLNNGNTKSCGCYRNERVKEGRIAAGYNYSGVFLTYRELVGLGKCVSCKQPNDGQGNKSYCSICRLIRLEGQKRRRQAKRTKGLCLFCPLPTTDGVYCEKCGAKQRERQRTMYRRKPFWKKVKDLSPGKARQLIEKYQKKISDLEEYLEREVDGV